MTSETRQPNCSACGSGVMRADAFGKRCSVCGTPWRPRMTPETHQPCMRKYVTCDADESADNWCEACRPRLTETRQPTLREALIQRMLFRAETWERGTYGDQGLRLMAEDSAKLLRDAADLLRRGADGEEAEAPAPKAHYYGEPLHVAVEDGALVIRIGVQTLAHAASYSDWANPYEDESGDYVRTFAITDAVGFANDVRRMLLDEREDGSSLLSDVLDKAMEAAVDDGSEHCEYEQRIQHGKTSPLETWASPRVDVREEGERGIVDLRTEMRAYLDAQIVTSENIGGIRRSLFLPWNSLWNGWVRDETAARENRVSASRVDPVPPQKKED